MKQIGHVCCGEESLALRDWCCRCGRTEEVQGGAIVVRLAFSTNSAPKGNLKIEAYLFCELDQAHGIRPLPEILVSGLGR
jgi:hypothetical protein